MHTFQFGASEIDALIRGIDLLIADLEQPGAQAWTAAGQLALAESLLGRLEAVERHLCGLDGSGNQGQTDALPGHGEAAGMVLGIAETMALVNGLDQRLMQLQAAGINSESAGEQIGMVEGLRARLAAAAGPGRTDGGDHRPMALVMQG